MLINLLTSLTSILKRLDKQANKGWNALVKKISPRIADATFIVFTITLIIEIFWFTTIATLFVLWLMINQ